MVNGGGQDTTAEIQGYGGVQVSGAMGTVANAGTIAAYREAIGFSVGGAIRNGSNRDTEALIDGTGGKSTAISFGDGPATLANFGTVMGAYDGVVMNSGGSVANGSNGDTGALIQANAPDSFGMLVGGGAGTVANFGTLSGRVGIVMFSGGAVTNGSDADTGALIEGHGGNSSSVFVAGGPGTLTNFGTATGDQGVFMFSGGAVTNGSNGDSDARIQATGTNSIGVYIVGGVGTVANFGTVTALDGVNLYSGGAVTNGSSRDTAALIQGIGSISIGVYVANGAGTVANFGTIMGAYGVVLYSGGAFTNGSRSDTAALVAAGSNDGVLAYGGDTTVTNFGAIIGATGAAVKFDAASDVLVVEARSKFVGSVLGGGGTLDLASGSGILRTVQAAGGMNETVSGGIAPSLFTNFATVEAGAGTAFRVTGDGVVGAGQGLVAAGGELVLTQAISGAGTIAVGDGGALEVGAATAASIAMTFDSGKGLLSLAHPSTFAAAIKGFADGDVIDLIGLSATSAMLGAGDSLVIEDGGHVVATLRLTGTYAGARFAAASDHLGGTDITVDVAAAATPRQPLSTGMASSHPGNPPRDLAAPFLNAHAFIQTMAGLGARGHAAASPGANLWRPQPPPLATPRSRTA